MAEAAFAVVPVADVPGGDGWLGPREREALERFSIPHRRAQWRAGRWAARQALANLVPVDRADVEILQAPDGAPEAWDATRRIPVSVSLSHRGGIAAAMAVAAPLNAGCDLELIEARPANFPADWFTAKECAAVAGARPEQRDFLVTLIWCAKEAALKVLREGLRLDTKSVEISLADGLFEAATDRTRISGWWIRDGQYVLTAAALEM